MDQVVLLIYKKNIHILSSSQKAMHYFRTQEYDKALSCVIDVIDHITAVMERINHISRALNDDICKEICDLLANIIDAKKNKDFVLLSDLLGIQLVQVVQNFQAEIIDQALPLCYSFERNKERLYRACNHSGMEDQEMLQYHKLLSEKFDRTNLIQHGYRIEATASGVMTVACMNQASSFYMHSNYEPLYEAFLLANSWYDKEVQTYVVYGLGLAYHIEQLCQLVGKDVRIVVYERDINVLKLSCAFADYEWMEEYPFLEICYDPEHQHFYEAVHRANKKTKVCIHYPSLRNVTDGNARAIMKQYIPYSDLIETY